MLRNPEPVFPVNRKNKGAGNGKARTIVMYKKRPEK
jgi:hypothetical protein